MNDEKLYLDIDFMEILESDDDICVLNMLLLYHGENRNKCHISKEAIQKSIPTIFNKPIIYKLNWLGSDFNEHNRSQFDTTMQICGIIPSGTPTSFVEKNGREYLQVKSVIYKLYQPKVVQILKNRDGNIKISIEILPTKKYQNEDTGILHIEEFKFLGVALLGDGIPEGIEGSSLEVLKYSEEDFNKKFLMFAEKYKIPQNVKNNAKKGLELRKEYGRGGTSVGINMAKYLVENEYATYEKVRKISQYFPRHAKDNLDQKDPPSNGWIAWLLWAGDEGRNWSENIVEKEEKKMDNSISFAKEDWGTGEALKVNKSKDVMSTSEWGSVDKTSLRNQILKAKNYKSIVDDVFLVVESGWEDHPSSSLKYPVMQIKGDELIYNRYGISSALGYAKAENNSEAIRKAEALYKKLGIDDKEDKMDNKIDNKLDKDNPELEKIRDDADAMEDDAKEKVKKNAVVDAPQNDKLKDDIDSDKDYWKEKYTAMEMKCNALQEEVNKYARKDEMEKMAALIKEYSHCFSDDDNKELEDDVEKCSFADMEKKISNKVMQYAKMQKENMAKKEDEKVDNAFKFSVGLPTEFTSIKIDNDKTGSVDFETVFNKYCK